MSIIRCTHWKNTVVDINLDYFSNWVGVERGTSASSSLGFRLSTDVAFRRRGRQGRVVTGDTDPEEGFYFRPDHLEFAMEGLPSLEPSPGTLTFEFGIGKRDGYICSDCRPCVMPVKTTTVRHG